MGFNDRYYNKQDYRPPSGYAPQMRMSIPGLTPVVRRLLIINVAVFAASVIFEPVGTFLYRWLELDATSLVKALQLWRLVTYQFLHDRGSMFHIIFNMLGLYFLGPALEKRWTGRKFLTFYLGCGVAGALFYLLLAAIHFLPGGCMVGASGAILGLLAASAILFPNFVVFILVFPVPIRLAAIMFTAIYIVTVITKGPNAGGDAAHLAGMAAGAIYVFCESWWMGLKLKFHSMLLEKRARSYRNLQEELDRILKKVHQSGLHSLTPREKKILHQATEAERKQNGL